MKIIPANGGGPGMDGVFLSGYGDGDYTPRPRSGPLPSLVWVDDIDPVWITVAPKGSPQRLRALMDGHCLVQ